MASKGTLRIRVLGDTKPLEDTVSALGPKLKTGLLAAGAVAAVGLFEGFRGAMARADIEGEIKGRLRLTEDAAEEAGEAVSSLFASGISNNMDEIGGAVEAVMGTFDGFKDASAETIEAASEDAINYAQAFETDVTSAVQTAQKLLEEDLVGSAEEAFDVMIAGASEVTPALREELQEATNEYSGYFADLGISAEEMYALFAQADSTFELDKTGDAIKELQIRATDMSTKSIEAYEAAGLSAEEMAGMILAGGDTAREAFDRIIEGLLSIEDPVERSNAAIALFGTPLEDMSVEEIPAFLESLSEMEGGLDNVAGASEGLAEDLDTPQRKFDGFIQTIQTVLTDALEPLVDWFSENEDAIRDWFDRAIEKIMEWGGALSSWWTETVYPVLSGLADNIGAWWEDHGKPALEGFKAWLDENWPTIQEYWDTLKTKVGELAEQFTTWWTEHAQPAIESLRQAIEDNWPKLEEAWDTLGAIIGDVGDLISEVADTFSTETTQMADDTTENQQSISDNLGTLMDDLNGLLRTVQSVTDKAAIAFQLARAGITGDLDAILRALDLTFPGLDEFAERARKMKDKIVAKFNEIVDAVQRLPGRIASAASGAFSGLTKDFRKSINQVISWWNNLSFGLGPQTFDFGPLGDFTFGGATISTPNVPYLARGAYLQANRPMLAVVGDNPTQPEIVAPEDAIRRIVREESGGGGIVVNLHNPVPEPTAKMVEDAVRVGQLMAVGSA